MDARRLCIDACGDGRLSIERAGVRRESARVSERPAGALALMSGGNERQEPHSLLEHQVVGAGSFPLWSFGFLFRVAIEDAIRLLDLCFQG